MVKLVALRPLSGDYGFVREGQSFETDEQRALILESRGLVERERRPLSERLKKMFLVPENKSVAPETPPPVEAPARSAEPPTVVAGRRRR